MIRKSNIGVSPTLQVSVGEVEIDYNSLMSIVMDYTLDNHDLCKVTMAGVPARFITEYIGKGIRVKIDTGVSYVSEFYGTIEQATPSHVTKAGSVNGNMIQEAVFVCMGASFAMRGSTSRSWRNYSLQDMATEFCDKYGFSLDIPSDPLIFPNMMQSLESDWNILVRYCHIMGYCVTVHGTHMHIFDPHKAAGRMISYHEIVTPTRTSITASPGQIVAFDGKFSRFAADGRTIDALATVHTDTGVVYDVTTSEVLGLSSPAEFSNPLSMTAENHLQAERMIKAAYRDTYDYEASVTVLGMAGAFPGGIVKLDRYDGFFDGLWYVNGVSHSVRSGEFLTTLDLRKNKVDTLIDLAVDTFSTPPPPTFINSKWGSTLRTTNVYT